MMLIATILVHFGLIKVCVSNIFFVTKNFLSSRQGSASALDACALCQHLMNSWFTTNYYYVLHVRTRTDTAYASTRICTHATFRDHVPMPSGQVAAVTKAVAVVCVVTLVLTCHLGPRSLSRGTALLHCQLRPVPRSIATVALTV